MSSRTTRTSWLEQFLNKIFVQDLFQEWISNAVWTKKCRANENYGPNRRCHLHLSTLTDSRFYVVNEHISSKCKWLTWIQIDLRKKNSVLHIDKSIHNWQLKNKKHQNIAYHLTLEIFRFPSEPFIHVLAARSPEYGTNTFFFGDSNSRRIMIICQPSNTTNTCNIEKNW